MAKISEQLNIINYCRRYRLPLWQCPQFLFVVMGVFIIATSVAFYLIGTHYIADPTLVTLTILIIAVVLFVIAFIITRSFERMAEASRMKSEFIDIVSHQLRSPLTNLKWGIDFLTTEKYDGVSRKQGEYFKNMKKNVSRMSELVDDLLIVSKIEQGTFPIRKKEISFEDLIRDLVVRSKAFAQAAKVKISFRAQRNLPKILGDPSLLKLVAENLIDNAIRYTKARGRIDIQLRKKEKGIFFEIKDSGVGIPEEEKKYIFQKFFRAEGSLKNKTKGSGLGLYIAKSIIEKSGGRIWFESKEGKGTTFYFNLPIK